jgi:type I restriction enzyme S subunit
MSSKQSTNLASINSTQLKAFSVAVPSVQEQNRIVLRICLVTKRLGSLKTEQENLRQQKQGLMHDLLTGKVEVKVASEAGHA